MWHRCRRTWSLLVIGHHQLGDKRETVAARRTLAEMAVDQAGCEHHEGIISAKRCHRFGNVLGGDQGARADDHTGRALVRRQSATWANTSDKMADFMFYFSQS